MTFQIMGTAHLGVPPQGIARCICEPDPWSNAGAIIPNKGCPFHQKVVKVEYENR